MASISEGLVNPENPIFRAWLFYNAILVLKMLAMSVLTAKQRMTKKASHVDLKILMVYYYTYFVYYFLKVFANPEDAKGFKQAKVRFDDEDVERVRRAHLNDLENILVYFLASYLYIFTNPSAFVAVNLFRVYTLARIVHTLVYAVIPLPQPARGFSWGVGYGITIYMGVISLLNFL
ncbi:microsomal glutathione S-transferase 1-like isoform X1 [Chrysoperla carnea]|uniref:microsomal glutathione S-transferase 1-like isoform X1 n=1 Tax=Chrysoperla carnea TaxID=189513 RepID=UPI001D07F2D9|nr:microsomal glutathione S-transferase 1-like isoform X1 [Chrysoperla carnea]